MARALLLALALAGCASAPTARGVALDFRDCFEGFPLRSQSLQVGFGPPLSVRCQCLADADRRCGRADLGAGCWRDGWSDEHHDGWAVAACDERARRGM